MTSTVDIDKRIDDVIELIWIRSLGTQSDDIKHNETAYINIQTKTYEQAKQTLTALIREVAEECIGENYEGADLTTLYVNMEKVEQRTKLNKILGEK